MRPFIKWGWSIVAVLVISALMISVPEYLYSQRPIDVTELENLELSDLMGKATYYGQELAVPEIPGVTFNPKVLGAQAEDKVIAIDLTNQKLYAYEGTQMVYDFLISSGKWGRTPTGTFKVWHKVKSTRMRGGSKELRTYYDLPNVPYTMFFFNEDIPKARGYGIHGAYWHNNFGHPMSHGCINMKPEEAGILYNWANPVVPENKQSTSATTENPGTKIIIYGKASMS